MTTLTHKGAFRDSRRFLVRHRHPALGLIEEENSCYCEQSSDGPTYIVVPTGISVETAERVSARFGASVADVIRFSNSAAVSRDDQVEVTP